MAEKLKSRKFWAMVVGVVMGVGLAFGLDENIISTVSGAVTALVSLVTYIITEGKIDAAAVANTIEIIQDAAETIEDTEE